ncbi:DDB1- and CUL4-associated factor 8-like [Dysidea avara]|uniref:DDB1- and CUL4-associated factor 8-like n=1 Tax=Dysidea avara TaxID=196820 RepID=UPI0033255303
MIKITKFHSSIFTNPSNTDYFAISGQDQFACIYDRKMASAESPKMSPVKTFCPDHLSCCVVTTMKTFTCLIPITDE